MQRGIKPYGQYSVKPSVRLIPLQTPAVYVVQGFAEILSAGDSDLVKSQEILLPRERKLCGPFPLVSGSFKVIPFAVLIVLSAVLSLEERVSNLPSVLLQNKKEPRFLSQLSCPLLWEHWISHVTLLLFEDF